MINKKEVIRMKVPYPSVNAGLAVAAHMYICKEAASPKYEYVKCQTLKPYLVTGKQSWSRMDMMKSKWMKQD